MGTSIESRESLNDGAIGDDYFVSVDAEDYEGGDEDDRPKNDDEGILHCERISANVSLVEPVKADSLMDEVECYGSKDVLLTEVLSLHPSVRCLNRFGCKTDASLAMRISLLFLFQ